MLNSNEDVYNLIEDVWVAEVICPHGMPVLGISHARPIMIMIKVMFYLLILLVWFQDKENFDGVNSYFGWIPIPVSVTIQFGRSDVVTEAVGVSATGGVNSGNQFTC